jgi:hypothetical protein
MDDLPNLEKDKPTIYIQIIEQFMRIMVIRTVKLSSHPENMIIT